MSLNELSRVERERMGREKDREIRDVKVKAAKRLKTEQIFSSRSLK